MAKKIFSIDQVKKITGAIASKPVDVPFYYAPPFLDVLRESIQKNLFSSGGRPTLQGADIVRKIRFSEESWKALNFFANNFKNSISPAQIAAYLLEEAILKIKEINNFPKDFANQISSLPRGTYSSSVRRRGKKLFSKNDHIPVQSTGTYGLDTVYTKSSRINRTQSSISVPSRKSTRRRKRIGIIP